MGVGFLAHFRGGLVFVEELCAVGHSLPDLGGGLQHFVLHLDERQRLLGVVGAGGGDCGDRVTLVEGLALGHHLQGGGAVGGDVGAGNDGADAWSSLGLGSVDGLDAGVGMGAPENLRVQQARCVEVCPVLGAARDLVGAVVPHRSCSHDLEFGVGQDNVGCHVNPPHAEFG